jgi:predicted enzyme related to lactoylglutathione lyase
VHEPAAHQRRCPEQPPAWSLFNGDRLNGDMRPLDAGDGPDPHWLVYFTVADLDDAARTIGGAGAIEVAPIEIPDGRILVARDPQGARFALFEGEVDP